MSDKILHNEKELLIRMAKGDVQAFEVIFHHYWNSLYSVAFLVSKSTVFAEDIAQELLLWVWREREKMVEVDNFKSYLNVAARNMVYRKLSRISLEDAYKNYASRKTDNIASSPESAFQARELKNALQDGINKLPPQQQKAFLLSREGGMTHEQIASEMKLSQNSVKDYIVKAVAFLRKHLDKYGDLGVFWLF